MLFGFIMHRLFNGASHGEPFDRTPVAAAATGQPLCKKEQGTERLQVWVCLVASGGTVGKGRKK